MFGCGAAERVAAEGEGIGTPGRPLQYSTPVFGVAATRLGGAIGSSATGGGAAGGGGGGGGTALGGGGDGGGSLTTGAGAAAATASSVGRSAKGAAGDATGGRSTGRGCSTGSGTGSSGRLRVLARSRGNAGVDSSARALARSSGTEMRALAVSSAVAAGSACSLE